MSWNGSLVVELLILFCYVMSSIILTFLDSNKNMLLDIQGYRIERLNRKQMARGGLALYIVDRLVYTVRSDFSRNDEGIFESPFIEINSGCKDLALGLIYRSLVVSVPSFMKILEEAVDSVQKHPCELMLMGDFILNLLDQNSASATVFYQWCFLCELNF